MSIWELHIEYISDTQGWWGTLLLSEKYGDTSRSSKFKMKIVTLRQN